MQTKPVALAVALLALCLSGILCAQQAAPREISSLLADYRKEFGKAKEPTDRVLRAEAAKIASKLVTDGNADAARDISTEVEDKIAGKQVTASDAALAALFARYDSAVVAAAKPIRDRFTSRVDALLRGNMSKDLNAVAALGDAKKVILGEVPAFESATDPKPGDSMITNPARGRKVLSDLVEGKTWEFQAGSSRHLFSFEKNGKLRWQYSSGVMQGTWDAESDHITTSNASGKLHELRFDAGGTFGEVHYLSSKSRYRMEPSTNTIPGQ